MTWRHEVWNGSYLLLSRILCQRNWWGLWLHRLSGVWWWGGRRGCRSGYERGLEHREGLLKGHEDNHMAKHKMMEHLEEEVVFSMKVLKQHRSAFERQVIEAVLIEMEDDGSLLNSKGGFNRCALPRLQVVIGDKPAENEERLTAFHDILTSQQTQGGKRKSVSKKTEDTSLAISPQKKKFKQDSVWNVRVERG